MFFSCTRCKERQRNLRLQDNQQIPFATLSPNPTHREGSTGRVQIKRHTAFTSGCPSLHRDCHTLTCGFGSYLRVAVARVAQSKTYAKTFRSCHLVTVGQTKMHGNVWPFWIKLDRTKSYHIGPSSKLDFQWISRILMETPTLFVPPILAKQGDCFSRITSWSRIANT